MINACCNILSDFISKYLIFIISAIYLIGAMALSMFSLVATVVVLAVHHHDPSKPLPKWFKSLLKMQLKATKVGATKPKMSIRESSFSLLEVTDLDVDIITDKKMFSQTEKLQTSLLYSILMELRKLNKLDETELNEWKVAAEKLDNIFFFTFLTITVLLNIILLSLYVGNT